LPPSGALLPPSGALWPLRELLTYTVRTSGVALNEVHFNAFVECIAVSRTMGTWDKFEVAQGAVFVDVLAARCLVGLGCESRNARLCIIKLVYSLLLPLVR